MSTDSRRLFVETWGGKVTAYNLTSRREEFSTDNTYTELGLIEEKSERLLLIGAGEYYDLQTNRYCFHKNGARGAWTFLPRTKQIAYGRGQKGIDSLCIYSLTLPDSEIVL